MDALSVAIAEMERGAGEAGCDNGGRDVALYFGQPFTEGRVYGNWCAAFASHCLMCAGMEFSDAKARRGAKALCRYVAARGSWVYAPQVLKAPTKCGDPQPGDLIAWHRGVPGSWMGHVGLVESYEMATDTMTTVEGNAGRFPCRVTRKTYRRGAWRTRLYGVSRP